jgi:hypothetical protein
VRHKRERLMRAPSPTPQSHLAHDRRLGFDTGKACKYCASSHHPIKLCHLRLADIKMGLETTCEYTNCEDNAAHRIDACTFLHARCSQRKLRGHYSTQCAAATPEFWRARFEQFALKGKFTAQRGVVSHLGILQPSARFSPGTRVLRYPHGLLSQCGYGNPLRCFNPCRHQGRRGASG